MSTAGDNDDQSTTTSSIDDVDAVAEGMNRVDISDSNNDDISEVTKETCAACGKEGNSDDMNICNKCKSVKYCNAACKKKHRKKHKKACEKRLAELHEELLFIDPPPPEECPICMLSLPMESGQKTFKTCCGKVICSGCIYTMRMSERKNLCAFCRTPKSTLYADEIKRIQTQMDKDNAEAFASLGGCYGRGIIGLEQDYQKARELFLKAGELGCSDGYYNVGYYYEDGVGVEVDKKKAKHYYELAAIGGNIMARHNLGGLEYKSGNEDQAFKHWILAAKGGHANSLNIVKDVFMQGGFTKDEYASTLRAYHERQKEMKSEERVKAMESGLFPGE